MITQNNISGIEELAIYPLIEGRSFSTVEDLLDLNIKEITGIEYEDWAKNKGKKVERFFHYLLPDSTKVNVIKSTYTYELDGWEVRSFERFIQYLMPDGSVGIEKRIKSEAGHGKIFRLNRQIKLALIDDLRERGKHLEITSQTVPEPYRTFYLNIAASTDDLLEYYYDVIHRDCLDFTWQPWIDQIGQDLLNPFEEDGVTQRAVYTNLTTPANADGSKLVKDIILEEITI